MLLTSINSQKYDIGRVAIFGVPGGWDGVTNFFDEAVHYGNTEQAVDPQPNPEYSEMTIEATGPAALKRYLSGERPEFELGVFPNPANMALMSPTGRGSAGHSRRPRVYEHTLWLVAEELFIKYTNGQPSEVPVVYSGGVFLKDGQALTADEQALVDVSMLVWRADFSRLAPLYQHEDGGKSLKTVTVTVQQDLEKPEGCQLYLVVGELADFPTLDLSPAS
jgi:hypothetical protein